MKEKFKELVETCENLFEENEKLKQLISLKNADIKLADVHYKQLKEENQKLKEKLGLAKKTLGEILDETDNSCEDYEEATHTVYFIVTKALQQLKEWVS